MTISNLVHQKTLSVGSSNIVLAAVSGRQSFYQAFGGGGSDVFFYFIAHRSAAEWEVGTGHLVDAATLHRDTVLSSSNGGTAVNFSAGEKDVVNDLPASIQGRLLQLSAVATSGSYADLGGRPPVISPYNRKAQPKVACIGSSYTQQQHTSSSGIVTSQSRAWLGWWNAFTQNALNIDVFLDASDPLSRGFRGANFGVSGQTSAQILARIPDVIAKAPDICVLQAGSNNVSSVEAVVSDVKAAIDQLYAAGILVVYLAISFRGSASWTAANCSQASQINARIRHYLASNGKGIFVDPNKYLCDADGVEGRPYVSALDTDSVHYTTWSAFQIGRVLHECVTPVLSLQAADVVSNADKYDATNNIYGNIWSNPFVSTNSAIGSQPGGVGTGVTAGTGTVSTSVGRDLQVERNSGSGTAVATIESRGSGRGNWQVVTIAPSGSGTSVFYVRHVSSDITHGLSAGTWVRCGVMLDVSTFGADALYSGFQNVAMNVDFRDSTTSKGKTQALAQYSAISLPNEDWTGVIECPPFQVPSGSDRLRPRIEIIVDDAKTGTGVIKAGGFYIRPCEDPSILW
jgi:hypothetical protein